MIEGIYTDYSKVVQHQFRSRSVGDVFSMVFYGRAEAVGKTWG